MGAGDYLNVRQQAEQQGAIDHDRGSWLVPFAAGIGAIGLGALLLKKRIAEGGNFLSNVFNILGIPQGITLESDIAANVGKSAAKSGTGGLRSVLDASFDFKSKRLNIGPVDLIDDLRTSIELMGTTAEPIANKIAERTVEFTNRELVGRGVGTGYFTQGLQRVTIGDIMENQSVWGRVLGQSQMNVVEKARSLGLISDEMILDRNLYLNAANSEVLDFRLRNIFSSVKPIGPVGSQVFTRTAKFDMFGQGEIISSILGLQDRNIAVLGPGEGFNGSRVFIGGNIFGYSYDAATAQTNEFLLATGRTLRKTGDALEVIAASREGRIQLDLPERTGFFGSIVSWFENTLGIGPAFASRPSFVSRWFVDPYRRAAALQSGEGVLFKHPFRAEFGVSKVFDAALGADLPELTKAGGAFVPIPGGGLGTSIENIQGVSPFLIPNRVGAFFGILDDYSVVKRAAFRDYITNARQALTSADMVVPPPAGGYSILGKTIPSNSPVNLLTDVSKQDLTALGFKSISNRYGYYDVASGIGTGLKDFSSYAFYRLNSLISETLGVGIAPDHRLWATMGRVAAIPLLLETARQGLGYADYLSEKFTGISPIKALGSIYAGARVAQQTVRQAVGLTAATSFLETYFPGSVNSDGSLIARSVVAPMYVANAFLKRGSILGAAVGAVATYFGIGGPSPEQTPSALMSEYAGDTKVPVRKGRLWGLGYLPFFGGNAERYESSWYTKLMSDYRTKSMYGSASEYWSYHANVFGIPFPTPSNLFGALNILNPYRMESMHYYDRPYQQTGSDLENFPIIGPLLANTVGRLIKPVRYRTPDELPLLKAGLADRGLTPSSARLLGIPAMNATAYEAEDPATPVNVLLKQANIAAEPLGLYKFVMQFFGVKLTPDVGSTVATSAMMTDVGRSLYDANVGGLFGQTEFIRRFLLSDYSSAYRRGAAINNVANNLPRWLPGAFSENGRDRDYFVDFTQGDPYAKIEDGEARLPGPGYEALNKLYSGQSGVYSDVDRFLILADVAPYSNAYKRYEKIVTGMQLDEEWNQKVQDAIQHRAQVIGVDTRYKRYEEDIINLNLNTVQKAIYAPVRKGYDFLTHDILAEIPYVGSKFFPFRDPYEQYRKMYVEGSEYASWDRPYEDIIRPAIYDVALEDPVTAAGKGAVLGFLMSGPMRWFTPIRAIVGGAGGHLYNPAAVGYGAAIGAGMSAARILTLNSQDMIPAHVKREEDAIQYMDTLAYIKGRMIENLGGGSSMANNTMLGAHNVVNYRTALLRSSDRRYFDYFVSQQDDERRSQIIGGLPDYMQRGLAMAWDKDFNDRQESDAQAMDFLQNNEIPSPDWLGWRPEISTTAARLNFVEHGINGVSSNIHRFGFYESHELDLNTRLEQFADQDIEYVQSPVYDSFNQFLVNQARQVSGGTLTIQSFNTPNASRREATIKVDRQRQDIKKRFR